MLESLTKMASQKPSYTSIQKNAQLFLYRDAIARPMDTILLQNLHQRFKDLEANTKVVADPIRVTCYKLINPCFTTQD